MDNLIDSLNVIDNIRNRRNNIESLLRILSPQSPNIILPPVNIKILQESNETKILVQNIILLIFLVNKYGNNYEIILTDLLKILEMYNPLNFHKGGHSFKLEREQKYNDLLNEIRSNRNDFIQGELLSDEQVYFINESVINGELTKTEFDNEMSKIFSDKKQYDNIKEKLLSRIINDTNRINYINLLARQNLSEIDLKNLYDLSYQVSEQYLKDKLGSRYTDFEKYNITQQFNKLIEGKTEEGTKLIASLTPVTKRRLADIYTKKVIDDKIWTDTFTPEILQNIMPVQKSKVKIYTDKYDNFINKVTLDYDRSKIIFDKSEMTIQKILPSDDEFINIIKYMINNYQHNYTDPLRTIINISKNAFKNINKDINLSVAQYMENFDSSDGNPASFYYIFGQLLIFDDMISFKKDNFIKIINIILSNIYDTFGKMQKKLEDDMRVYFYMYMYLLIVIDVFSLPKYIIHKFKGDTSEITIYFPQYNNDLNMSLIVKNPDYEKSSLRKYITEYLQNIDYKSLDRQQTAILDDYKFFISFCNKKVNDFIEDDSISDTLQLFRDNQQDPKINGKSVGITEYANYYINLLKREEQTKKIENEIKEIENYKATSTFFGYVSTKAYIGCSVIKKTNVVNTYDTKSQCFNAMDNEYLFDFKNPTINNLMKDFWLSRKNTDDIEKYAKDHEDLLKNIQGYDINKKPFASASNLIKYYRNNYKWVVNNEKLQIRDCNAINPKNNDIIFKTKEDCVNNVNGEKYQIEGTRGRGEWRGNRGRGDEPGTRGRGEEIGTRGRVKWRGKGGERKRYHLTN